MVVIREIDSIITYVVWDEPCFSLIHNTLPVLVCKKKVILQIGLDTIYGPRNLHSKIRTWSEAYTSSGLSLTEVLTPLISIAYWDLLTKHTKRKWTESWLHFIYSVSASHVPVMTSRRVSLLSKNGWQRMVISFYLYRKVCKAMQYSPFRRR